jgi:methylglutaconyl-CoA hydratase
LTPSTRWLGLRAVIVKSKGKHFQAGADLKWLNAVRISSPEENIRASRATAEAVQRLNLAPVPTVALVQGACFGGGTGILAACDVVIAADNAIFSIAEVRWGLTAAIIIPQLNDAISVRQMRRYALTGERFDAQEARHRPKQPRESCHSWKSARQYGDEAEAFGPSAVLLKSEPLLFGTNSQ